MVWFACGELNIQTSLCITYRAIGPFLKESKYFLIYQKPLWYWKKSSCLLTAKPSTLVIINFNTTQQHLHRWCSLIGKKKLETLDSASSERWVSGHTVGQLLCYGRGILCYPFKYGGVLSSPCCIQLDGTNHDVSADFFLCCC